MFASIWKTPHQLDMLQIVCSILALFLRLFVQFTSTNDLDPRALWSAPEDSPRFFPPSFLYGQDVNVTRVPLLDLSYPTVPRRPAVTVVLLNWSRLDNVIRIASLLCGESLQDTVAEVFVWNNSPQKLSYEVG